MWLSARVWSCWRRSGGVEAVVDFYACQARFYERHTRLLIAVRLPGKGADHIASVMTQVLSAFPPAMRSKRSFLPSVPGNNESTNDGCPI